MDSIRAVIIDDEEIIIGLIRRLGAWDKLNIEIAGTAADGEAGYRLIKRARPDIVLLDIRMSGLDGLELVKRCLDEKLESHFIIISGYQEFEYAKKAIHYNISDYIVKPIDEVELNHALKRVCDLIGRKKQEWADLQELQTSVEEKTVCLWEDFFARVLKGETDIKVPDFFGEKAPPFTNSVICWCAGIVKFEISWENRVFCKDVFLNQFLFLLEEKAEVCFSQYGYACDKNSIWFLLPCFREKQEAVLLMMNSLAFLMDKYTQGYGGGRTTVGISTCAASVKELPESLRKAEACLNLRFYGERGKVCFYNDSAKILEREIEKIQTDKEKEEELYFIFSNQNVQALTKFIKSLYVGDIGKQGVLSRLALKCMIRKFFDIAQRFGVRNEKTEEALTQMEWVCDSISNVNRLFQEAVQFIEAQFIYFIEERALWNDRHIRAALQYISVHYADEIQLEDVASAIGLNSAYLSGLFKSKTGMTYSEHLLKERMEAAKTALAKPDSIIKNVCCEAGYRDVKYFSRLFRKYTGVNPSVYQKMHSVYSKRPGE